MAKKFYQVITTSKDGEIHGGIYSDARTAVFTFAIFLNNNGYAEVMFHQMGQLTCTLESKSLSHAEIVTTADGNTYVVFHANGTREDMKRPISRAVAEYEMYKGSTSLYYPVKVIVIDLKAVKEVFIFDHGVVTEC